jgi:hypothetical protein
LGTLDKMHFRALDSDFNATSIIEGFSSVIWNDRYSSIGDFELHGERNQELIDLAKNSSYIFNSITSGVMVIEKTKEEFNEESGNTITISGRSISSVLDRRIMLDQLTILNPADPRISQIICNLVSDAFAGYNADRYWDRLGVVNSTAIDSVMLPENTPLQFEFGANLLTIVTDLCAKFTLGFKCELVLSDRSINFIVYEGVDRTYSGENQLIFADLYDNILTSSDEQSNSNVKNTILVAGNKEDPDTKVPLLPVLVTGVYTGLERREVYFKTDQEPTVFFPDNTERAMTDVEYQAALQLAGEYELMSETYSVFRNYDGEIIENENCKYGTNFSLGDLIIFRTITATQFTARLTEIVFSSDESTGKTLVPNFSYESVL